MLAFFIMVWMTQSQTYPTQPTTRRPQFKISDDEFNWYKPVAVILKPASKRDLQQRLLQVNVDEFLFPSYQPSLLPPWPFVQDYSAFRRWINYQSSDRLRDLYSRYELPGHVEHRLTSLARMGLVAIPKTTKINRQRNGNNRNQEKHKPEQSKIGKYFLITLTSVCVLMYKDWLVIFRRRAFPDSQSLRFLFREKR